MTDIQHNIGGLVGFQIADIIKIVAMIATMIDTITVTNIGTTENIMTITTTGDGINAY